MFLCVVGVGALSLCSVIASSCFEFRGWRPPIGINPTKYLKGTSLETIDCQSEQDLLCSARPNMAEDVRERREAIPVFDVMPSLAEMPVGTPSLLDTDEDDMSNVRHVSKAQKREGDENEPMKNPVRLSK